MGLKALKCFFKIIFVAVHLLQEKVSNTDRQKSLDGNERFLKIVVASILKVSSIWPSPLLLLLIHFLTKAAKYSLPNQIATLTNSQIGGSGCGTVGKVVASDTRDLRFKSSHR